MWRSTQFIVSEFCTDYAENSRTGEDMDKTNNVEIMENTKIRKIIKWELF